MYDCIIYTNNLINYFQFCIMLNIYEIFFMVI